MVKLARFLAFSLLVSALYIHSAHAILPDPKGNYPYLIITCEDLYDVDNPGSFGTIAIEELREQKLAQGLSSKVHLIEWDDQGNPPSAESIRDFIQQQHQDFNVNYVLIAGDFSIVPQSDSHPEWSDYFLSVPYGSMGIPVVMIGRFPVKYYETAMLRFMIEKSLAFENLPSTDEDYASLLMIAAKDNESDPEYEHNYCSAFSTIESMTFGAVQPVLRRVTGKVEYQGVCGDLIATNQDILDEFNAGARIAMYRGHGTDNTWKRWDNAGTEYFGTINGNTSTVDNMENSVYPVVLSGACDTAKLGNPNEYPSLAQQFMRQQNKGAAAFVGFQGEVHMYAADTFVKTVIESVYDANNSSTLGMAIQSAFQDIAAMPYNENDYHSYWLDARMLQTYGDPAMRILRLEEIVQGPSLVAPVNDAALYPFAIDLVWNYFPGASHYEVELSLNSDFAGSEPIEVYSNTYHRPESKSPPRTHYWRVRAIFGDGTRSDWSETRHFAIASPKAVMTSGTVYPFDNFLRDYSQPLGIGWTVGVSHMYDVTRWYFEIYPSDMAAGDEPLFADDCLDTEVTLDGGTLEPGEYRWRVRAEFANYPTREIWGDFAIFELVDFEPTSCPVLSVFTPDGWIDVNPLLTQCEESGYKRIVSDFHDITPLVTGSAVLPNLRLREQEKEITRLDDFGVVVVSNPDGLPVGATPEGEFFAIKGPGPRIPLPLPESGSAMTSGAGSAEFSIDGNSGDLAIALGSPVKLPCLDNPALLNTPSSGRPSATGNGGLAVFLREGGEWVELTTMPHRTNETLEYVILPGSSEDQEFRLVWRDGLQAKTLNSVMIDREAVDVNFCEPRSSELKLSSGSLERMTTTYCELRLGDAATFNFEDTDFRDLNKGARVYVYAKGYYYPELYAEAKDVIPEAGLSNVFPNPCNPIANIEFRLDASGPVEVALYNMRGEKVSTLESGIKTAGVHRAVWDGRDLEGTPMSSGVYFVRFSAGSIEQTTRLVLLK